MVPLTNHLLFAFEEEAGVVPAAHKGKTCLWVTNCGNKLQKTSRKSLTKKANRKLVSSLGYKLFTVKGIHAFLEFCLALGRDNTNGILWWNSMEMGSCKLISEIYISEGKRPYKRRAGWPRYTGNSGGLNTMVSSYLPNGLINSLFMWILLKQPLIPILWKRRKNQLFLK